MRRSCLHARALVPSQSCYRVPLNPQSKPYRGKTLNPQSTTRLTLNPNPKPERQMYSLTITTNRGTVSSDLNLSEAPLELQSKFLSRAPDPPFRESKLLPQSSARWFCVQESVFLLFTQRSIPQRRFCRERKIPHYQILLSS